MKKFNGFSVGEIWFDHAGNKCFYRENGTISCQTINDQPSDTVQSEKDSCDFNLIYSKYISSGRSLLTNCRTEQPMYGDFSSASDYHDTIFRAQQAQEAFMDLPASIRARFSNDPGQLIDFVADSNNRSEAIELGLIASPQALKVPQGESINVSESDHPPVVS